MSDIGGFISAPIKLAALINSRRLNSAKSTSNNSNNHISISSKLPNKRLSTTCEEAEVEGEDFEDEEQSRDRSQGRMREEASERSSSFEKSLVVHPTSTKRSNESPVSLVSSVITTGCHLWHLRKPAASSMVLLLLLLLPLLELQYISCQILQIPNLVPASHFQYSEGRQRFSRREPAPLEESEVELVPSRSSHIYKRSSALLVSSPAAGPHYPPLVGSSVIQGPMDPLRRRMMASGEGSGHSMVGASSGSSQGGRWIGGSSSVTGDLGSADTEIILDQQVANQLTETPTFSGSRVVAKQQQHALDHEAELLLLKQKQHIQYHDQWPSLAGKCHKRTLNFCASVLPFNTTTFPNIIGDTNRFEVKRSLPFFGFLAKSSCNKRLDELLCLLLEPPCATHSGVAIPPCKKFCRLALEGCNEYIPATLAMSSVFDCRQYPDSNDPATCVNLAQGNKCAADEFKCPDKTCIPRNWLCDGVRDCIFAADEANCTAPTGVGLQTSVCSTEEFKCDGKCVPKAWKCDGERDCLDGSDEEACDLRPRCGPDRFKCADGNGCIPKRWVCDGKAECRDGSDEMYCEQLECSENDFKCDNGICIPKLWRCDRQPDCKDASDERNCVYPTSSTTTTTTTAPVEATDSYLNISSASSTINSAVGPTSEPSANKQEQQVVMLEAPPNPVNYYTSIDIQQQSAMAEDVARIINQQVETQSSGTSGTSGSSVPATEQPQVSESTRSVVQSNVTPQVAPKLQVQQQSNQATQAKDMKKFDYDIIQSAPNVIQLSDLLTIESSVQQQQARNQQHQQQLLTQIDFAPQQPQQQQQQQQQQQVNRQVIPVSSSDQQQQQLFRNTNLRQHVSPQAITGESGQQHQATPERIPIYRSLFKSLKGGQVKLAGAAAQHRLQQAQQHNAQGRRRRDRHQHALVAVSASPPFTSLTTQAADELARLLHWTSSSPSLPLISQSSPTPPVLSHTSNQATHLQHRLSPSAASSPVKMQAKNHGVASYLQLLNSSRYNLRPGNNANLRHS